MDIKAYIASGILEQYVLGMTSDLENQEVQRYANMYPEVQKEIDNIESALFKYSGAFAVIPPVGLKERILSQLEDTPTIEPSKKSNTEGVKPKSKFSNWDILILSVTALLSLLTYNFYNKKINTEKEYEQLKEQFENLEKDCISKSKFQDQMTKQIAMMRDGDTQPIRMKGTPLSPESETVIYWNDTSKKAYLDIASLPEPVSGKQYQLWAIVDGKPVDMGVFDLPNQLSAFKEVTFIDKPQAFAVTLEPTGGLESPTMDQMYVVGEI